MRSIILYCDGGSKIISAQKRAILSWGIVALFNDEHHEHFGHTTVHLNESGFHEMFAFAEAILFATSLGYQFHEMTFYVDDELIGYNQFFLHEGNGNGTRREMFIERIKKFCTKHYGKTVFLGMMKCLARSRFVKLKGHAGTVYNQRADYLAHHARKVCEGRMKDPTDYITWLKAGFQRWNSDGKAYRLYIPFANVDNNTFHKYCAGMRFS